jgi:uncharacterized protein YqgC (DUF456 family)
VCRAKEVETSVIGAVLLVAGVVLLFAGYAKNNRNVLLLAGILLLVAAILADLTGGFVAGVRSGGAAPGARQ